jgi:ParB family chromosome partitioning protein
VIAEGWKWVTVIPEFNYVLTARLRRIYPEAAVLADEQQAELEAREAEYEALSIQYQSEDIPEAIEAEFQRLDAAISALRGEERFRAEDMAIGGAFVSLGFDANVRIERGFVRSEDEPAGKGLADDNPVAKRGNGHFDTGSDATDADDETGSTATLPDRLIAELTAYRTAALREALGQNSDVALIVLLHALALRAFYGQSDVTCLEVEVRHTPLEPHAPSIAESAAERTISKRHTDWARRLPKSAPDLWTHVSNLSSEMRLELLAHCVALSVNAVSLPWERRAGHMDAADALAEAISLDMTAYWQPTAANYFGRVTKAHILDTVREAV